MMEPPATRPKVPVATWLGLCVALFGVLIVRQIVSSLYPTLTFNAAVWKEVLIWICAAALLMIVRRGEGLPLSSIGLGTTPWWKSVLWGFVLALACFLIAGGLVALTHFGGGPGAEAFSRLPLWLITLIVVRAGVVEELFYRGYAIERLLAIGFTRFWAVTIPLVIFAVAHWTGGWANILIALVLGVILSAFYLWRRDLVANMIAHFLVDFVANVLPQLFGK